jgi:threonine/homoserine/homoserine lactone efflux protein
MLKVVIGEILPLAVVVTISPLNIIPAILLLFTSKPLANGLSFVAGFVGGIALVLALFISLGGAVNLSTDDGHSTWAGILKLILGSYLLFAAVRKFRGRPGAGAEGSLPKWMDGIAGYSPGRALGAGVALGALNPKNVVVGLASAAAISAGGLSTTQQVLAGAIYLLVAVFGVVAPMVVMLSLGDGAHEVLEGWNLWLRQNNAIVMSVLFLVFGVVLIGQGIGGS